MNWQLFSVVSMIVLFIGIIALDVFLLTRKQEATFSERLRAAGRKWQPIIMIVSFGFGLLCGHWWWGNCNKADAKAQCQLFSK